MDENSYYHPPTPLGDVELWWLVNEESEVQDLLTPVQCQLLAIGALRVASPLIIDCSHTPVYFN